ncbi:IS21 family transposase [Leisingera sp. M523]|nr:IS21 family transposase [Leisingera sp. M523]
MRKIKEVLRLRADGLSLRQVARSLSLGRATVSDYLRRAEIAKLTWPLPEELSDTELEARLFPPLAGQASRQIPLPDWAYVHAELRRKGVTLALLWQEYREVHPDGYGYSQYCSLYSGWEGKLAPVMRQRHPAGERLFVDYAGQTVDVVCPETGEVRTAQIFVTALGASNYTYVEATWTQSLPDWLSSHVRAFSFFGGVPAMIVSDNLKSAVIKACFHDPAINRTYGDMAAHYDTAVVPARPRKPKDKAKVETAVQLAERWILARLRNQTFFGLDGDGRFPRVFKALTKTQLLILDDWGPDRLNANQRRDLMEIVEDRYGTGSTLITSQLPLNTWHEVIGEPTFADAILDRLVHNAYRLELEGQSFRKKAAKMDDEKAQN